MSQHPTSEQRFPEALSKPDVRLREVKVADEAAIGRGSGLTFPAEDRGQSLAEMAQRDLDAALQLLADRAQYITGASGAAIALRHEGEHDMLCRASAGTNAPEIGALLSTEFGLSGESVRTQKSLRCDDAERDARVNRDSCRELGIASVAVTPILSDGEVLGVFELFSGKAHSFTERDVAALERLAEMVETAERFARAAQFPSLPGEAELKDSSSTPDLTTTAEDGDEDILSAESGDDESAPIPQSQVDPPISETLAQTSEQIPAPKPLLWSATGSDGENDDAPHPESGLPSDDLFISDVPLALRALRKCEACGFPVSEGRRLCLDCDEKDWRGQRRATVRESARPAPQPPPEIPHEPAPEIAAQMAESSPTAIPSGESPILSLAMESPPSWLAANKYVLGAIAAVALAIGAVVLLR
jgi:hypothetical protein